METNSTQQEILLFTGTSFADSLTGTAELEAACWDGLLADLLPELYPQPGSEKTLYLWTILEGSSFLELDLGELPPAREQKDGYYSIDPYSFLATQSNN